MTSLIKALIKTDLFDFLTLLRAPQVKFVFISFEMYSATYE